MVTAVIGKIGSGKTFWAVRKAEKEEETTYIVHNIPGFEKYRKLEKKDMIDFFINLHKKDKENRYEKNKDAILQQYIREYFGFKNLGPTQKMLFILDEIDKEINRFGDKDLYYAIDYFLSYSRHFFIDVIIITQSAKRMIENKWEAYIELYVRALPASARKIPGILEYEFYNIPVQEDRINKDWNPPIKTERYKVNKYKKEYAIGDSISAKNTKLYKYIGLITIVILVFLYSFYNVGKTYIFPEKKEIPKTIQKKKKEKRKITKKFETIIRIVCYKDICNTDINIQKKFKKEKLDIFLKEKKEEYNIKKIKNYKDGIEIYIETNKKNIKKYLNI